MDLTQREQDESKARILKAAGRLFSEKGFDGTRVNEIAALARVNKALIYYYFKNKEAILDQLLQTLFDELTDFSLDFVREHIVQMITDGRLDIQADRFHFSDETSLKQFLQSAHAYNVWLTDYVLERRQIFRIMLLESLKNSKHRHDFFRFVELLQASDANPVFKVISDADRDFDLSAVLVMHKFFFGLIPVISFAAYFDDWKTLHSVNDQALRDAFIQAKEAFIPHAISGNDLLLTSSLASLLQ